MTLTRLICADLFCLMSVALKKHIQRRDQSGNCSEEKIRANQPNQRHQCSILSLIFKFSNLQIFKFHAYAPLWKS